MGDRCYLHLTVRKDHFEKLKACDEYHDPSETVEGEHVVELTYYEANYANSDMLEGAVNAGCDFYGWHGTGSEYDAANFFSHKGNVEYLYTGTDNYGMIVSGSSPADKREHLERLLELDAARDEFIKRLNNPLYDLVAESDNEPVQR